MSGRHAQPRNRRLRVGLVAVAGVAAALVGGGTVGAMQLTGTRAAAPPAATTQPATSDRSAAPRSQPTATPTAVPSSAQPSRSPERASRGGARPAAPSPTPTTATGRVVASGTCGASYYDEPQPTANGEQFDPEALTAAHKTWAFDTRVRVTNPDTGKSVVVRINDRGPYVSGRCIDLSRAAFRAIAPLSLGEVDVRYEVLAN